MDLRSGVLVELKRRAGLLPAELEAWTQAVHGNIDGMGIHGTQIEAIGMLFKQFVKNQEDLLADLEDATEVRDFTGLRYELEAELSGSQGLLEVFRQVLAQRDKDSGFRQALDAADLVAAACYKMALQHARDWGVVEDQQFREPPLNWLNARSSPAAIRRGRSLTVFGQELDESLQTYALPVPVISLRFPDVAAIWSLCSIYHEAAHLVDFDLGLRKEVTDLAIDALGPGAGSRRDTWKLWGAEMLADTLGVLWGGAGFAYALVDLLFLEPEEVAAIRPGEEHPVPTVRIALLAALLRQTGVAALKDTAGEIEAMWEDAYGATPAGLTGYVEDCPSVAEALMDGLLFDRLGNRPLRDLAEDPAKDHEQAVVLCEHLLGQGDEPDTHTYPLRMVPAAARLALQGADGNGADLETTAKTVHEAALAFIKSLPRPEFMADPNALTLDRASYLESVAGRVRFGRRRREEV